METIRGRQSRDMDAIELYKRLEGHRQIQLDLGTGDGRFVCKQAEQHKDRFFIGVDACRENLHVNSRKGLPNALFVVASAQALPYELHGLASRLTINFPWGSLLEGLLKADPCLMKGLSAITRPAASLELYLNADALATAGCVLDSGVDQIENVLNTAGWNTKSRVCLKSDDLRVIPTTWAKRLAFGRAPRAIRLGFQK